FLLLSTTPSPPTSTLFPYTTLFRSGRRFLESLPPYEEQQALALGSALRKQGMDADLVAAALTQSRLRAKAGGPGGKFGEFAANRSEEHTSELQSRFDLVCRLLLEKK